MVGGKQSYENEGKKCLFFFLNKVLLGAVFRFRTANKIKVLCKLGMSELVYHSTISNLRTHMQSVQPKESSRGRSFKTASVGILTSGHKTQEVVQQCEKKKKTDKERKK